MVFTGLLMGLLLTVIVMSFGKVAQLLRDTPWDSPAPPPPKILEGKMFAKYLLEGEESLIQVGGFHHTALHFEVLEGPTGGTISPEGIYRAPDEAGIYHLRFSMKHHPSSQGELAIEVHPRIERGFQLVARYERLLAEASPLTVLPDGKLFFTGFVPSEAGRPVERHSGRAFLLDGASGALEELRDAGWEPQPIHATLRLRDGRILLVPPRELHPSIFKPSMETFKPCLWLFEPSTRRFRVLAPFSEDWGLGSPMLLSDGKVLIPGKVDQLFDPSTDRLFPARKSKTIYPKTMAPAPHGQIVLVGGELKNRIPPREDQVHTVYLWDPVSGKETALFQVPRWPWTNGIFPFRGDQYLIREFTESASCSLLDIRKGSMEAVKHWWAPLPKASMGNQTPPEGSVLFVEAEAGHVQPFFYNQDGFWDLEAIQKKAPSGGPTRFFQLKNEFHSFALYAWVPPAFTRDGRIERDEAFRDGRWFNPYQAKLQGHTLTELPGGSALVAGGIHPQEGPSTKMLRYDPAYKGFLECGHLNQARTRHTASPLLDGRVLLVGGHSGWSALKDAEIFDPKTSQCRPMNPMAWAREGHTATRIPDGAILVMGGNERPEIERFDPIQERFDVLGKLNRPRWDHVALLLGDGCILVAGGQDAAGPVSTLEKVDPRTGSSVMIGALEVARWKLDAVSMPDGAVLLFGGYDETGRPCQNAEKVFPEQRGVFPLPPLPIPMAGHRAMGIGGGEVLLLGGMGPKGISTVDTYVYQDRTKTYRKGPSLRRTHPHPVALKLPKDELLVAGGDDWGVCVERYCPGKKPKEDLQRAARPDRYPIR